MSMDRGRQKNGVEAMGLEHIGEVLPRAVGGIATGSSHYVDFFDSPCESPIEDIFASYCLRHLRGTVSVDRQVEVDTQHGHFRIDFVLTVGGKKIAVECDGRDFHNRYRDEFRDALLLGGCHFETVYHFRGCDITYWPDDCIWLMSVLDPRLFSERGHRQLGRLHHSEVNRIRGEEEDFSYLIWDGHESFHFWAFRRSRKTASAFPHLRYHWKVLYDFAGAHPGLSLDELIALREID